jgi:hypothetical protein
MAGKNTGLKCDSTSWEIIYFATEPPRARDGKKPTARGGNVGAAPQISPFKNIFLFR